MPEGAKRRLNELMRAIRVLRKERQVPPTVRELAEHLGRPSSGVHHDLRTLRKDGRVEWEDRKPRTLRAVRKPR